MGVPPDGVRVAPRRRAPALVAAAAAVAAAAPPVAWIAATADPRGLSVAVAAVVAGALVAGGTVAAARRAWAREVLSQTGPGARVPTTTAAARLAGALGGWEAALGARVAAQQAARAAAEEADRFESEFVRQLSHELRTPLNAILGFTQVLLDDLDGPLDPAQQESVEAIRASGEVLRELVDEVLDLAALQSGQVSLALAAVDPGPVVEGVARVLRGQVRGKPVAVRAEVVAGTAPVHADPRRLRQILLNLGSNAVKFTEVGEVVVAVAPDPEGVRFVVRDTGPGIPEAERGTLFDAFVQASNAEGPDRGQGSGLGLSIVARLVELQRGRVALEDEPGGGARFVVVLPAAREAGP